MNRRIVFALLAAALVSPRTAIAGETLDGHATRAEEAFVTTITRELPKRFPTPEAARKAGYVRYTDEDDSGAISYANKQWTSKDAEHPSQVWFDAKNRLIGADYSVPMDGPKPPELFGLRPQRWQQFPAHVHYALVGAKGTIYGGAGEKTLEKGGGTIAHPTASALVAAGVAKSVRDVRFVFAFPAIWDVSVWVVPNPSGAFAEKNPDVKPASAPKEMKM